MTSQRVSEAGEMQPLEEARRLLEWARNRYGDFERLDGAQPANLTAAQVYATLALVQAVNDVASCIERYVGGVW